MHTYGTAHRTEKGMHVQRYATGAKRYAMPCRLRCFALATMARPASCICGSLQLGPWSAGCMQVLAAAGVASRRACEELIGNGEVSCCPSKHPSLPERCLLNQNTHQSTQSSCGCQFSVGMLMLGSRRNACKGCCIHRGHASPLYRLAGVSAANIPLVNACVLLWPHLKCLPQESLHVCR